MSNLIERIKQTNDIDASVVMRGTNPDGSILIEAILTKFKSRTGDVGGADIVKKVNSYAQAKDLIEAQNAALERAADLLGLGLEE